MLRVGENFVPRHVWLVRFLQCASPLYASPKIMCITHSWLLVCTLLAFSYFRCLSTTWCFRRTASEHVFHLSYVIVRALLFFDVSSVMLSSH